VRGETYAFLEVKTRTILESANSSPDFQRIPEHAVNGEKRRNLSRMAREFLHVRYIERAECRFDVLAIETAARRKTLRAPALRYVPRPTELTHHRDCTLVRKSQLYTDSTRSRSASS
jgi:Holliday junction resolvase-like predicted endonuclease